MRVRRIQRLPLTAATLGVFLISLPLSGCATAKDAPRPAEMVVCLTPGLAPTLATIESKALAGSDVHLLMGGVTERGGMQPMLVIAALMRIPGSPNQVGVWATRALGENPPRFLSVNRVAKHWTTWPDAAAADVPIHADDPSIRAATACLQSLQGATG